ncbi:hypothetical protein ACQKKK_16860 [Peribacillus sp. NPDC006672]|uniref:hypothetical protein n=1 Tax=Peribacillus sp. NPDC006672 TaxID=3390606 RepID=UPI003D068561
MDQSYNVNEAAKVVGVTPSTIKKYYLMFEKDGYKFRRTTQGQLSFTINDVVLFKNLIQMKNEPGVVVSKAVKQLLKEKGIHNPIDIEAYFKPLITELREGVLEHKLLLEKQQKKLNMIEQQNKLILQLITKEQRNNHKPAVDNKDHKPVVSLKEKELNLSITLK